MHKILILAKVLLQGGGVTGGGVTGKKQRSRWLIVLLLFAFGSIAFSVGFMTYALYDFFSPLNQADAILPLALGATSVVIFLFGVLYTVSVMYHADDVPILLGLPLRPYQILGAKFLTLVVYEYLFEACILLPVLVAYGIKSGSGALYIVYSVVLFALLPVIALVMASVIVMLVMRFTRFGKNKQVFNFISGIVVVIVAIGFNIAMQTAARHIDGDQLLALTSGQASLASLMSRIFPGVGFAATALSQSAQIAGLWNLLLFVLCTAAAAAVFLGVGQLIYFKGLAGVTESSAKRKRLSSEAFSKQTVKTPVYKAYVVKELRLLMRSPVAFLNCVFINIMWPVLILIMLLGGGQLSMLRPMIAQMDGGQLIAILAGLAAFVSSSNAVASTAISREGKTLYFTKYIPVALGKQLSAKAMTAVVLSGIGLVLQTALAVALGVGVATAAAALVVGLVAASACSYAGLMIDAARPKLSWINEQQAIKQNINVMLHMLLGVVFAAALIVPVMLAGMTRFVAAAYVAGLCALLALILRRRVQTGTVRTLEQMDV